MGLKKILVPNFKKVSLFLMIFIIFVPFINYDNGIRCILPGCDVINSGSLLVYSFWGFPYVYQINYLILFGGILVSYLLSSFLIRNSK